MSATYDSVVIQYITYTAKQFGGTITVNYLNGSALAVSVSSQTINVTIVDGTTTNANIKAAVDANTAAAWLVSTAITGGHTTDTPHTCKGAVLSAGVTTAVKASQAFGGVMKLTAATAGVAGNSIRFKFTSGATAGSEVVTVSTNDITVQIADGVSTYTQVKTAIDGNSGAHALVAVASAGPALSVKATVAAASAFTALSGGADAAPAAVTVQNIVVTSKTNDATQNGKTLTYTDGATAGAEVVTVTSGNVSVQIQSGTSTAAQLKTALNAAGGFSALYTADTTGTTSTVQVTVNGVTLSGAASSSDAFYKDQAGAALTSSLVQLTFGFMPKIVTIANDETSGTKNVYGSWDGVNQHFLLLPGEVLTLDNPKYAAVFLKYVNAAPAYRVWAE